MENINRLEMLQLEDVQDQDYDPNDIINDEQLVNERYYHEHQVQHRRSDPNCIERSLLRRSTSFSSRNIKYGKIIDKLAKIQQRQEGDVYFYPDLNYMFKVLSHLELNCLPPTAAATPMNPILPRIYFGTIAVLMIERASMIADGSYYQLPRDNIVHEFFTNSGFLHSIQIPKPLVPVFKALNCQRIPSNPDYYCVPKLGNPETLATRHLAKTCYQLNYGEEMWRGIPDIHELYLLFLRFCGQTVTLPPESIYMPFRDEEKLRWRPCSPLRTKAISMISSLTEDYDFHNVVKNIKRSIFLRAGFNYEIKGSADRNPLLEEWTDFVYHGRNKELNPQNLRNFLHLNEFSWFQKLINEMNKHYCDNVKTKPLNECLDFKSYSNSIVYYRLTEIKDEDIMTSLFSGLNDPIAELYEDNMFKVSDASAYIARQSFLHTTTIKDMNDFRSKGSQYYMATKKSPVSIAQCNEINRIINTSKQIKVAVDSQLIAKSFK